MAWRSLTNGRLIEQATSHFDLFVTLDRNIPRQNRTGNYPLGILILKTRFNDLAAYRPQFGKDRDSH